MQGEQGNLVSMHVISVFSFFFHSTASWFPQNHYTIAQNYVQATTVIVLSLSSRIALIAVLGNHMEARVYFCMCLSIKTMCYFMLRDDVLTLARL